MGGENHGKPTREERNDGLADAQREHEEQIDGLVAQIEALEPLLLAANPEEAEIIALYRRFH